MDFIMICSYMYSMYFVHISSPLMSLVYSSALVLNSFFPRAFFLSSFLDLDSTYKDIRKYNSFLSESTSLNKMISCSIYFPVNDMILFSCAWRNLSQHTKETWTSVYCGAMNALFLDKDIEVFNAHPNYLLKLLTKLVISVSFSLGSFQK